MAGLVRNVQSLIAGGYSENSEAKTEFTELSVAVDIQNGVGRTQDIRLLGPFVRMSGQGSIDLAAQTIDMRLDPRVVGSLDGQGGDFDISGLGMPILVKGTLSAPSIYPDISDILADPNRALQALSQLGGGVGELANGATGAVDGLGEALRVKPGAVVSDLIGSAGETTGNGAPSGERGLLNAVLGGVLAQQMPGTAPASAQTISPLGQHTPPIEATLGGNAPAQAASIPLPRADPRAGSSVVPTSVPEPEPPATLTDRLVNNIVPQLAPENDGDTTDLIKGLIQQVGI
ncbi:AsmA-like C-terminal region-containing protein [Devosia naphthalenivorans]|uniref:AsmA-like C-terminal region-containing protein n=1 Tax=Devosia naphthalenivorans TaxID=2082392 RepID=UPI0013B05054|nr:AsmA-like C-terminal region-containing protein [Devosia naphthalenivorans]